MTFLKFRKGNGQNYGLGPNENIDTCHDAASKAFNEGKRG